MGKLPLDSLVAATNFQPEMNSESIGHPVCRSHEEESQPTLAKDYPSFGHGVSASSANSLLSGVPAHRGGGRALPAAVVAGAGHCSI